MQKVAIWGAARGLGAVMVDYFHQQGIEVIAIARDPNKNSHITSNNIQAFSCDATDQQQVIETIKQLGENIVHISTMGSFNAQVSVDYIGHRYLIDALQAQGNARFLLITSLGCGDSWQYLSERARKGFGSAVREKSLAEAWLQSSDLDFTILRPGGLKDGKATEQGELSQHKEIHGVISRGEVARLSHQLLLNNQSIGQIYQCIDPNMTY